MDHNYYGLYNNIKLAPLKEDEIERLREWRNQKEETRFLRDVGYISKEMQLNWFQEYLKEPNIFIFSIHECEKLNRMIGSVALYNFRDKKAELGKIQIGDKEAHGIGAGKLAMAILCKIGFELMGLDIIDGHVNKNNVAAYKNDLAIGFKVIQKSESGEDYIQIDSESLALANGYYNQIEINGR